jgi:prevent-host-death family protein
MPEPRFSEDVRPITELKVKAAEIVNQARDSKRPVLLTRRGRGVAVLLDLHEYEKLVDRAAFVDAVKAGAQAASVGDLYPHEEAKRILDSFGVDD